MTDTKNAGRGVDLRPWNTRQKGAIRAIDNLFDKYLPADTKVYTDAQVAELLRRERERWIAASIEAHRRWDSDQDAKLGKLLIAMANPDFGRTYSAETAALHGPMPATEV